MAGHVLGSCKCTEQSRMGLRLRLLGSPGCRLRHKQWIGQIGGIRCEFVPTLSQKHLARDGSLADMKLQEAPIMTKTNVVGLYMYQYGQHLLSNSIDMM